MLNILFVVNPRPITSTHQRSTPIASSLSQHPPHSFFGTAEVVTPKLIGCLLVKLQEHCVILRLIECEKRIADFVGGCFEMAF